MIILKVGEMSWQDKIYNDLNSNMIILKGNSVPINFINIIHLNSNMIILKVLLLFLPENH